MSIRFALILSFCLSMPAFADDRMTDVSCDDSTRLTHMLKTVLRAERLGTGLRDPETLLEVWVTQANGEWMIVQNYTNGTSCIVAMGDYWEGAGAGPA